MQGHGADRHLMGLKLCLKAGEDHPFLLDPIVRGSNWFRMSTSSLSSGDLYNGTGFGSVTPDGYGINYCIGKKVIKFGIESKKHCRETSTTRFKHAIIDAFYDVKRMCLEAQQAAKI